MSCRGCCSGCRCRGRCSERRISTPSKRRLSLNLSKVRISSSRTKPAICARRRASPIACACRATISIGWCSKAITSTQFAISRNPRATASSQPSRPSSTTPQASRPRAKAANTMPNTTIATSYSSAPARSISAIMAGMIQWVKSGACPISSRSMRANRKPCRFGATGVRQIRTSAVGCSSSNTNSSPAWTATASASCTSRAVWRRRKRA